jgi:transposase-like protein
MGTNIMAAGLVDEGIKFEKMEEEIAALKEKLSSGKPVCPYCHAVMHPFAYKGYYDEFVGWSCSCEKFPKGVAEESMGAYVS